MPNEPTKAKRGDYVWCAECNGYVLKRYVRQVDADDDAIFEDERREAHHECPEGHTVTLDGASS
jgi:hypothetical protein